MNILIVKIGAIGDVVMALSAVDEINSRWPEASITWVCGKSVESLLKCVPSIKTILTVNETNLFGGIKEAFLSLLKIRRVLAGKSFDYVLIGHSDKRYHYFCFFLGVRTKKMVGFGKWSRGRIAPVPGRYHGDEYRRMITQIDDWQMKGATFPKVLIPPLSEKLKLMLSSSQGKMVALAPGGARNFLADDHVRRWPIENYVSLARGLKDRNLRVLLIGDKSDCWIRPFFSEIEVVDLVGSTSLTELLSTLTRMSAVITHDSGILHLALLLNKPIVALFGPTDPSGRIPRNFQSPIKVLWPGKSLPCCPCYDGKFFSNCGKNLCLEMISVADVLENINQLLSPSGI